MDSSIELPARPHLVIRPSKGWTALDLRSVWLFKDLLITLASRDVKLRYRQTALGVVWVLLQPLLAAGIFSFVFGKVAKLPSNGVPYFLFAYAGLLGWNAFSSTLTKTSGCLVQNSGLISKVFFPRLILPLSTLFSTVIDFAVALGMMVVLMVFYHVAPGPATLLLPVWLALIMLLSTGIGLICSALMVSYRDVQYVLPVVTQFLLYASPVAYAVSAVPERLRAVYFLNPLSGLLEAFRWSLLGGVNMTGEWKYVAYSSVISLLSVVGGALHSGAWSGGSQMSSKDIAVSVQGISKSYQIAHQAEQHTTLGEALSHRLRRPFERPQKETFWALKDVSFDIKKGQVAGIIGRNGAGKSTLLKILSQITEPTAGEVQLYGRVGSLLEVGTGFHPELTGRENIYLNGAILGMQRREIARHFDEIVDFAEVESFLDTPVKRYSSGMYVRLAFAVAAHLNPAILIIDEVLAVGDAEFQKKCLGKMQQVAEKGGRTVLFVSHNMQAVSTLTQHCILMAHGQCAYQGPTETAITKYLEGGASKDATYTSLASPTEPRVTHVELMTSEPASVQCHGRSLEIMVEISTPGPITGAALSLQIVNDRGQPITHLMTLDSEIPMCREAGVFRLRCCIPQTRMYIGRYFLNVYLAERAPGRQFQAIENVCPFEVVVHGELREYYWSPGAAAYVEEALWKVNQLHDLAPPDVGLEINASLVGAR